MEGPDDPVPDGDHGPCVFAHRPVRRSPVPRTQQGYGSKLAGTGPTRENTLHIFSLGPTNPRSNI